MSKIEKEIVSITKHAVTAIGNVAEAGLSVFGNEPRVAGPLRVILAITTAVQDGISRDIDPREMLAAIDDAVGAMRETIERNQDAIDKAADEKFGKREPPPPSPMPPKPADAPKPAIPDQLDKP